MNIVFGSTLSASCFADMLTMPQHRDELLRFMAWRMTSYSCRRWHIISDQHAKLNGLAPIDQDVDYELNIGINSRDISEHEGLLYSPDINWLVRAYPTDEYGYGNRLENAKPINIINGGFINHGTFEEPDWHSHT